MHRLVRAVGAEDGRAHMLLHLPPAQHAWSAAALLRLQRLRCAVPSLMPPLDGARASLHSEATGECSEASAPHTGAVVREDGVLVLRSVGLHARRRERGTTECSGGGCESVHVEKDGSQLQAGACGNERRKVNKGRVYEYRKTGSAPSVLSLLCCCLLTEILQRAQLWMDF